ncbi:MAG: right-handed parallel beta-helix repeat-containing protein [bacterium]|nr:right-handed parallel beta-helix repeat-containing protein [bacterium]
MSATNFSEFSKEQPLVFVDWWSKEVQTDNQATGIVDAFADVLGNSNNWEAMFTFLPEARVDDEEFQDRFPLYRGIAHACSLLREDTIRFTGGGLLYDVGTMSPDWAEFRAREEFLQLWWKNDPISTPTVAFDRYVLANDSVANATFRSYPVPYPEDHTVEVDSVVLQYRFDGTTSWQTSKKGSQSDSTYDFSLSLPDTGGYVEYRVWSFDDLGRYGSYPPYGTKWTDAEAGERNCFTFERRKDDAIVKPDTFWLPGVITKEHQVAPNGKLVFQPLPGYKHATLYVGDDAKVTTTWTGSGNQAPQIVFNGTDTSYIHVKPLCDTCKWKGIFDSVGVVVKNYVTFHEGTGEALVLKNATGDSKAQFNEAAFEDSVLVKGPTEITGTATFNKLIVENGATLTILPGSALSFLESGQLIVKKGGKLKAFGNDSTGIVFKAVVDSLPWEGIHCEADSQMAACSLKYVSISGAVAGLLLDRSRGYAEHCVFHDNLYGALVNNGAWFEAVGCSVTTNEVGIAATNLSTVELLNVVANYNTGPGLKGLSRASFYLEDCFVNDNGGDGVAGGIGLYTGSNLFMECTEVASNIGSGITAYGGTIMLTSVKTVGDTLWQWQGNRIEHNATIPYEGQITLRDRTALALWNGNNCIWDTTGDGRLVHWEDQVGSDRWADVYWGSTDTAAIKSKLPSNVTLVRIDSSRTLCPTFTADNSVHDSLVQIFLLPHNAELSGQYTRADSGYKAMIRNSQSSDYALSAVDRLLSVNLAQNKAFGPVRDTLATLYNNVSSLSLKRWIKEGQAWCWAELDDSTNAAKILDSLAQNTPTRFDRVAARAQKQMLSVRLLRVQSAEYKASDCIAYLDSAQKALEVMKGGRRPALPIAW